MINLYDGNNVMRRSMERKYMMPNEKPMGLRMRLGMQGTANDIWVWDGKDHNERRRDIYPPYKMNREPMAEDIFAQIRLWREVLRHTDATQVEVHGWEADDVIGTLVRKYPGRFKVHTNDMDYGQVKHLCELSGVNMKDVPPEWVTLYKAMVGDSSDNIDGIPGFGPGRWLEIKDHWPACAAAIAAGDPAAFVDIPFKPKVKAWLTSDENIALLQAMFTITHFHPVPDDELEGGITKGDGDLNRAYARLEDFFL